MSTNEFAALSLRDPLVIMKLPEEQEEVVDNKSQATVGEIGREASYNGVLQNRAEQAWHA